MSGHGTFTSGESSELLRFQDRLSELEREALFTDIENAKTLRIKGLRIPLGAGVEKGFVWVQFRARRPSFQSLAELAGQHPAPSLLQPSLYIARETLMILDECHRLGFVHGALSPSSVELGPSGVVEVSELGTRRLTENRPDKTTYKAPEVWLGNRPSPRSDVFSVGCILATCLFGQLPDLQTTPLPSIRTAFESASPKIDGLLQRLTALEPSDRPPSAKSAAQEILRYLQHPQLVKDYLSAAKVCPGRSEHKAGGS